MMSPSNPPATVPDRHPHPLTVEPESIAVDRQVSYQISPRIDGQLVSFELLVRRVQGKINLWAESATEITWPRGLCEEHETLVFGPDGGGLRLGDQRVVALGLPTETFERIQEDILSLQSEEMEPADSPAFLDTELDEATPHEHHDNGESNQ